MFKKIPFSEFSHQNPSKKTVNCICCTTVHDRTVLLNIEFLVREEKAKNYPKTRHNGLRNASNI